MKGVEVNAEASLAYLAENEIRKSDIQVKITGNIPEAMIIMNFEQLENNKDKIASSMADDSNSVPLSFQALSLKDAFQIDVDELKLRKLSSLFIFFTHFFYYQIKIFLLYNS